jgi:hypothetical protein
MTDKVSPAEKQELLEKLALMQTVSNMYYRSCQQVGIHTFIEHTGFINEHLKILTRALVDEDVNIAHLNNHGETTLRVMPYEADYLAEKFACMFAPILKDKAAWKAFVASAESKGCGADD